MVLCDTIISNTAGICTELCGESSFAYIYDGFHYLRLFKLIECSLMLHNAIVNWA